MSPQNLYSETLTPKVIVFENRAFLASIAQWIDLQPTKESSWFHSQSGHMPGLWAGSLVRGVPGATDRCFFLSLSLTLSLSLKVNK